MQPNISKHGDVLEQAYNELLLGKLPAYVEIWSRFIGNDGTANLIEIPNLDDQETKKREIFSQYHYSAFESLIGMKLIADNIDKIDLTSIEGYISANNEFLAFQAHTGRVHDCLKKMGTIFRLQELEKELYDYYQQRNEILHGCKIPFMIIEGLLAIPAIMGRDQDPSKWHSDKSWNEVKPEEFAFLSEYLSETLDGITKLLNKALYKLLPKIIDFVQSKEFVLDIPIKDAEQRHIPSGTGITDNHFFVSYNSSASASFINTTD